jgi:hypothetical protein
MRRLSITPSPGAAPIVGNLRSLLRDFFTANPHEWLTPQDVAAKYGVTVETARTTLSVLKGEGLISRETVWHATQGGIDG